MKSADCDTLWSALPMPALLVDASDRIIEANPASEFFLNTSRRSLEHAKIADKLAGELGLEPALSKVRRDQAPVFINNVTVTINGQARHDCNLQLSLLAPEGEAVLVIVQPRDLAMRLGRSNRVKSAARSAIGMSEMLAHEIKNPLAGITGAAQLLSMSLNREDRELTDLIVAESRRIVALLEQVEQFGNLRPPERRAVNIHDLLDRARKSAQMGYGAHLRFVESYDPSLPPTWVDGDQFVQVFLNLLKNAAQASGETGTITLRTYYDRALSLRDSDGSEHRLPLQIEISDDGPGIPHELAREVFEPFVSGHENGTGLGLALVSKIISDHNGWISLDSEPGRTTFRIALPVAPKE